MTANVNPLVSEIKFQEGIAKYKEIVNKYHGKGYYFGCIEKGLTWNEETCHHDKFMTYEDLEKQIKSVSPVGPAVKVEEVVDVTPSYEFLCKTFPQGSYFNYNKYQDWLSSQEDTYHYARGNEEFSVYEAYQIASGLGYKKIIMENLS